MVSAGPDAPGLPVIVLAGGFGTRLRSVVADLPKPLALVAGRPFLFWLLDDLARERPASFALAVSFLGERIMEAVGEEFAGIPVRYSVETEALGTGGAIRRAFGAVKGDHAIVVNGDTFQHLPFAAMTAGMQNGEDIAMAVRPMDDTARYGRVRIEGARVTGFEEKGRSGPGLINAGAYLVARSVFDKVGSDAPFSFETEILARHVGDLRISAVELEGDFIDIGVPEDFARAQTEIPRWATRGSAQ